jgi:CubicO group peptidase (beta-lactamase class C family)
VEPAKHLWRRWAGPGRLSAAFLGLLLIVGIHGPALADEGFSRISEIVGEEIAAGHVPGAVVLVGRHGRIVYRGAFGSVSLVPVRAAMPAEAIFDLASLTKVIATTTAVMQLAETARLALDKPVADYWPPFAAAGKGAITVRQLLTHTSGLRADLDPNARWTGEQEALAAFAADHPVQPPGTRFIYSDLNFIVLGELVRRVSDQPLDVYAQRHIFAPLHMTDTGFRPALSQRPRIVPTDRQDGQLRWGEVQDPTAYRMGGVAGHAGLFSTADDIARFATMLLDAGSTSSARILKPESVAQMTRGIDLPGGVRHGLGWDIASPYAAGIDTAFGGSGYGHTGYTGTMLWVDPSTDSFLIVLTSRLHPNGGGDALRQKVAQVVASATATSSLALT